MVESYTTTIKNLRIKNKLIPSMGEVNVITSVHEFTDQLTNVVDSLELLEFIVVTDTSVHIVIQDLGATKSFNMSKDLFVQLCLEQSFSIGGWIVTLQEQ